MEYYNKKLQLVVKSLFDEDSNITVSYNDAEPQEPTISVHVNGNSKPVAWFWISQSNDKLWLEIDLQTKVITSQIVIYDGKLLVLDRLYNTQYTSAYALDQYLRFHMREMFSSYNEQIEKAAAKIDELKAVMAAYNK